MPARDFTTASNQDNYNTMEHDNQTITKTAMNTTTYW